MESFTKRLLFILYAVPLLVLLAGCSTESPKSTTETPVNPTPSEVSTPVGDGRGDQSIDDSDLAYWNGLDFGPNLEYAEEFAIQGDPGEYPNAAEAAKRTFYMVRDKGYIPEYNDDTDYTMTLIGLTDVEEEESYVYRLDVEEPTGTIGASYAYAYQSGNIYMQGYGGQWVIVVAGATAAPYSRGDFLIEKSGIGDPGDINTPEWWGDYTATAYVIVIAGFYGTGFNFEAYKLDAPAHIVASGFATLYPDNELMAEYSQMSFSLYEDYSALDILTPEDHNLSGLRGHYVKSED